MALPVGVHGLCRHWRHKLFNLYYFRPCLSSAYRKSVSQYKKNDSYDAQCFEKHKLSDLMSRVVQNADGTKTIIHFLYNVMNGAFDDFKFK